MDWRPCVQNRANRSGPATPLHRSDATKQTDELPVRGCAPPTCVARPRAVLVIPAAGGEKMVFRFLGQNLPWPHACNCWKKTPKISGENNARVISMLKTHANKLLCVSCVELVKRNALNKSPNHTHKQNNEKVQPNVNKQSTGTAEPKHLE